MVILAMLFLLMVQIRLLLTSKEVIDLFDIINANQI